VKSPGSDKSCILPR